MRLKNNRKSAFALYSTGLMLLLVTSTLQAGNGNFSTRFDDETVASEENAIVEENPYAMPVEDYSPPPPVDLEAGWPDMHLRNQAIVPDEMLLEQSCSELDLEISYLIPYTYQYKPDFYDDAYNGAAIWGTAVTPLTVAYLPYSWAIGYQETERQTNVFYRIEKLRRAKQIKHCFENLY